MNRRAWLRTAGGILAAPAIVRAESIMRVRPVVPVVWGRAIGGESLLSCNEAERMMLKILAAGRYLDEMQRPRPYAFVLPPEGGMLTFRRPAPSPWKSGEG